MMRDRPSFSISRPDQLADLAGFISANRGRTEGLPRRRVVAAVGAFGVQVKRLPATAAARQGLDEVRRNVRRHFLVGERDPILAGAVSSDGLALDVAAFDAGVCEAIVENCRRANVRLIGLVPEACAAGDTPLLLPVERVAAPARVSSTRLAVAALVFLNTLGFALATPGLVAHRDASENQEVLAGLSRSVRATSADRTSIDETGRVLAHVDTFARSRRSMTLVLAALTNAVPPANSISDVRLDSAGGTFVVVGPRVAGIVDRLAGSELFTRASLSGAVTPQQSAAGLRERATVRFQWGVLPQ